MGTEASVQGLLRNSPGWLSLDPPEGKQGAPEGYLMAKFVSSSPGKTGFKT